jgi:hypothetical protein
MCSVCLVGGTSARGLRACGRGVDSAHACNRSRPLHAEVTAPSTEQRGEGGASLREDFGRRPLRAPAIGADVDAKKRLHRRSR